MPSEANVTPPTHPITCRCGATLGHDAGTMLILAPHVVVVTRVRLQCRTCGSFRWWCPAPNDRERAAQERWERGAGVGLLEL